MDGEQPTNTEEQAEQARYPIILTRSAPPSNFFNMI